MGTQDLGTGTRTIMTQVAAETLGLPMGQIKLVIGDNSLPPGGIPAVRPRSAASPRPPANRGVNALAKLFEAVAPGARRAARGAGSGGRHRPRQGQPQEEHDLGRGLQEDRPGGKISETGANEQRNPMGLNSGGAAGVQMADVSVDIETGLVKMNRFVAVQDCGLIINPRLAESQIYGAIIMGISTALYEERIMDDATGRMLNPDMEFYKLAGIKDIGDIVVHLDIREVNDKRGVIGLGEPPAIGICAAVGNAVANAIGVRVPNMPMTPMNVLNALEGRNA